MIAREEYEAARRKEVDRSTKAPREEIATCLLIPSAEMNEQLLVKRFCEREMQTTGDYSGFKVCQ